MQLLMEGYDHILDIVDEEGVAITDVVTQRGDTGMGNLLASIPAFEVFLLSIVIVCQAILTRLSCILSCIAYTLYNVYQF